MEEKGLRPIAFACQHTNDQTTFEEELKLLAYLGLKI